MLRAESCTQSLLHSALAKNLSGDLREAGRNKMVKRMRARSILFQLINASPEGDGFVAQRLKIWILPDSLNTVLATSIDLFVSPSPPVALGRQLYISSNFIFGGLAVQVRCWQVIPKRCSRLRSLEAQRIRQQLWLFSDPSRQAIDLSRASPTQNFSFFPFCYAPLSSTWPPASLRASPMVSQPSA
jgi:hypothetical protein